MPPNQTVQELFYPTDQKIGVLEQIARHEVVNVNQLVYLLYGHLTGNELESAQRSVARTTRALEKHGLVFRTFYRPEAYKTGMLPFAIWLSEDGAQWAWSTAPQTNPKSHFKNRSYNTIPHDLRRTDTRIALYDLALKNKWDIACRKDDLVHLVKPDDLYEITKNGKTSHFFLEEEVYRKSFEDLYDKLKPYVDLHGTSRMKDQWGFRYFNVIVPMRDNDAKHNLLVHLKGSCNCPDPKLQRQHKNAPFKLKTDILWLTSHDFITQNTAERIFETPNGNTYSLDKLL